MREKSKRPYPPLPEDAIAIQPPIEVKLGTWIPQGVDAKVERHGVTWYRILGGFGGRGDREDWIADFPISISVNDYSWNGESFGPNYGTFDNACLQQLKSGLHWAEKELAKIEERKGELVPAIQKLREALRDVDQAEQIPAAILSS